MHGEGRVPLAARLLAVFDSMRRHRVCCRAVMGGMTTSTQAAICVLPYTNPGYWPGPPIAAAKSLAEDERDLPRTLKRDQPAADRTLEKNLAAKRGVRAFIASVNAR